MPRALFLLSLLSLLFTACRSVPAAPPPVEAAPPPPASVQPVQVEEPCPGDGFIEVERWLSEGLLVLGEQHGTEELPRAVAQTVCAAAAGGRTAWLALELPRNDQERLESFLATGDEVALLAGPFWRRDYQDGRSSHAMLGLLREVRRMRAAGRDVRVLAFDVPFPDAPAGSKERDAEMADLIAAARARAPAEPMVLLVGNIHATRRLKIPRSLVWYLVKQGVSLKTLDVGAREGSSWTCGATCGAGPYRGADLGPQPGVFETPRATQAGYDGVWYVVSVTASPPAWIAGDRP